MKTLLIVTAFFAVIFSIAFINKTDSDKHTTECSKVSHVNCIIK